MLGSSKSALSLTLGHEAQFRPHGFNVPLSPTDCELSPPPANHSAYRGVW